VTPPDQQSPRQIPLAVACYTGGRPTEPDRWFVVWDADHLTHLRGERFMEVIEVVPLTSRLEVDEASEICELRDLATSAILDALSWMDPGTAERFMAETSYRDLLAALTPDTKEE
jgi:hypothetical protein